jgi:hypothetical protein
MQTNKLFSTNQLLQTDILKKVVANFKLFTHTYLVNIPHSATVCSESRCALRLQYVDLIVSIEVAVEMCCFFNEFSCSTAGEVQYR